MSLSQQTALEDITLLSTTSQIPVLATAGERVAQLTSLKDTAKQISDSKILSKYSNILKGIQAQTVALSDSFSCNLPQDQVSEITPVLEELGYTVTKGSLNRSTNRIALTIEWKIVESTIELTGVSPTNLELYLRYPYSTTFYPQGGTAPYKFKLKEGQLPQGTVLTKTTTALTLKGTPTLTGVDYMVIETQDAAGVTKTTTVPWIVKAVVTVEKPVPVTVEINTNYITGTVPLTSKGQLGDREGQVAADASYIYYCTASYVTQMVQPDIWKRVTLNGSTWP